jgi:flavin reductase (DIM6/NTAB) family NADH-FMN oxidoreductase RutF
MFYQPELRNHGLPYNPFKALIVPRPIGWISTCNENGTVNLAPYSYFNGCHTEPPVVMFGAEWSGTSRMKDTLRNVERTGEFVCNFVGYELREAMNKTATEEDVDEMDAAALEKLPSRLVKPPRVAASPVHLECRYLQSVTMPCGADGLQGKVVFGQVIGVHIRDEVIVDGIVDFRRLRPIARMGYMDYVEMGPAFGMDRPV